MKDGNGGQQNSGATMTDSGATRLMAVIHADVVDYSGHVRLDREWTATAVAQRFAAFDKVAKSHGAQQTTHEGGDSFLGLFLSAQSAVATAIASQKRFQQMNDDDTGSPPIHVRMGV